VADTLALDGQTLYLTTTKGAYFSVELPASGDTIFFYDSTFVFQVDSVYSFDTVVLATDTAVFYDTTVIFQVDSVYSFDTIFSYDTLLTYDTPPR